MYGSSFGGFIALNYASNHPVIALGLKAPVSDYLAVFNEKYHSQAFQAQLKNIDLHQEAKNIIAPTLIVHGSDDDVVPLKQSEKLLEVLSGEKRLSILHGATHDIKGADLEDATTQLAEFFINKLL